MEPKFISSSIRMHLKIMNSCTALELEATNEISLFSACLRKVHKLITAPNILSMFLVNLDIKKVASFR